ncbi:diaminohydroxyphosphoribosylaminopyrimidine deaminase [Streptomyces sp. PgraA7]|nr:diaminohydroxyphosphoribosylaminopyrimidine deaminase [Streptomyces sp. PgraA7]
MSPAPSVSTPGSGRTANAADRNWLALACELAALCPPSATAFSVGAVIVAADGTELARGYSRESDPHDHAEEGALAKLSAGDARLGTATIYSSLEPCAKRASRPRPCAQLIQDAGLRRVVTAWSEPDTFVTAAAGTKVLEAVGVTVIALAEYANAAQAPNLHLL